MTITSTITSPNYEYEHDHNYGHDRPAGKREVPRPGGSGAKALPAKPAEPATPFHRPRQMLPANRAPPRLSTAADGVVRRPG